ncbi:MAG: ribosome biogenesis GTPase Der [Deltaproteobacteria bacterium]|nr:ribosome biogenesis GTPase Der [Deltaproteobacteria bacterium]
MSEINQNTKPVVAIVGRPNVGKSTLFNRLTGKWRVTVEDIPGVTRDRIYGQCELDGQEIILIDTGGLQHDIKTKRLESKMSIQALRGIEECDLILFILDGRSGMTSTDRELINKIRKLQKPKVFAVNKVDDPRLDINSNEFYELGIEAFVLISAEHKRGFSELCDAIIKGLSNRLTCQDQGEGADTHTAPSKQCQENMAEADKSFFDMSIAISGRPNVGKSTLLNALLNEERCIVDDAPGTTRDPIHSIVSYNNKKYRFIDTAGIRKRARTTGKIETFSVMQALKVVDEADIVLLLIDSIVGPTEQDAHVAGYAFEKNKAMILIANKWDEGQKKYTRTDFQSIMELKMNYLKNCPILYCSAKTGKNLNKIFDAMEFIRKQYDKVIKTSKLNKSFQYIIENHPLPVYKGQQMKMYYATQVSTRPPSFVVFCNYPKQVHFSYKRYLINALREQFELKNVPVKVLFKAR